MVDNHLSNRDIVFITDLSCHVIPAGMHILQTTRHDDTPNLDWMPPPPDLPSFVSSQTISSWGPLRLSQPLLSSKATLTHVSSAHCRPDPEGVGLNPNLHHRVPSAVFMGGSIASQGGISLMTIHKLRNMGGAPLTPSLAHSVVFEPAPLPSGNSVVSVPQPTFPSSPRPPPPITSTKDKPSGMGLKDITDKESWIEGKVVINPPHVAPYSGQARPPRHLLQCQKIWLSAPGGKNFSIFISSLRCTICLLKSHGLMERGSK